MKSVIIESVTELPDKTRVRDACLSCRMSALARWQGANFGEASFNPYLHFVRSKRNGGTREERLANLLIGDLVAGMILTGGATLRDRRLSL